MLPDEPFELADQDRVATALEVGVDPILEHRDMEFLEPRDLCLGEGLVHEVGEWLPAPEGKSLGGLPRGDEGLEAIEVKLARIDAGLVAGSDGEDSLAPERLAELRDVDLECLLRRFGRPLSPEGIDQAIGGDDPIGD